MKATNKMRHAKFLLILVAVAGMQACHKSRVKSDPKPVNPIQTDAWKKVASLPNGRIQVLEVLNNKLYAGSDSGVVYNSTDGITWAASNAIQPSNPITAITVFNNIMFVGSATNGIYMSTDGGKNWINNSPNFPKVSSFTVFNNTLYSASAAYSGIMEYDEAGNKWSAFVSNGLPTNYNLDVQKIIFFNNTLLSLQGENGNYYLFDKTTNYWTEKYFFNSYTPGLWANDIIYDLGTLLAAYDNAIFISEDVGVNWSYDTIGLRRANLFNRRTIYAGRDKYYTIHNTGNAGIWLQRRDRLAVRGTTWATGEEYLSFGYSWAVRELNGMLFLATDNGLYFRKIS
ncbi:MAG TPA: hypothetical protein VGN20_26110 [Mucilaginibacter sp.]|jgi:hypothetical protein